MTDRQRQAETGTDTETQRQTDRHRQSDRKTERAEWIVSCKLI